MDEKLGTTDDSKNLKRYSHFSTRTMNLKDLGRWIYNSSRNIVLSVPDVFRGRGRKNQKYWVNFLTRCSRICVFYSILYIVRINAIILLQSLNHTYKQNFKNRRSYVKILASDIIKSHLKKRFQYWALPTSLPISIGDIFVFFLSKVKRL